MPRVPFLCLAHSRKHGGRCLAGVRLDTGQWLRPVSELPGGELLPEHTCYPDGSQPRVLDRFELALAAPAPQPHHPENWRIAPGGHRPLGAGLDGQAAKLLGELLEPGPEIFGNRGGRVPCTALQAGPLPSSLALVRPQGVLLHIEEREEGGCVRRKVRASFRHGGVEHRLAVTDPAWERALEKRPACSLEPSELGLLPDQELLLTVSLSEPFGEADQQACYKLIAAIIPVFKGVLPAAVGACNSPQPEPEQAAQARCLPAQSGNEPQRSAGLLDELRRWRNDVARQRNVPPYHVLHNAHLQALLEHRPRTAAGLELVPGFGPVRVQEFGADLLAILARYAPPERAGEGLSEEAPDADALRALELRAARLEREMRRISRELERLKAGRGQPLS